MYSSTMILVADVNRSREWYVELLGASAPHGGDEFEMLMDGDRLLLMLHHLGAEGHPAIVDPSEGLPGRGVLLYFNVDDIDSAFARAQGMEADVLDEVHVNEEAHQREFSLRDPDGYAVTVASTS
jgi:catechol 2,3-dioxygenase-like lactoylglutathione lyase family enzyme